MLELSNKEILLAVLFLVGLIMNIFDVCKNNKNRKSINYNRQNEMSKISKRNVQKKREATKLIESLFLMGF